LRAGEAGDVDLDLACLGDSDGRTAAGAGGLLSGEVLELGLAREMGGGKIVATMRIRSAARALSIRVTGDTQQLYVNGAPFDTEARPVQQTAPDAKTSANIRLTALASASPLDIRLDNLVVTQTPPAAR
jgi:hypothetical protein